MSWDGKRPMRDSSSEENSYSTIDFHEHYKEELETMNKGKVGPPIRLTPSYIQLLTAIRYLYQMPYRQPWKDSPADQLRPPKTHPRPAR